MGNAKSRKSNSSKIKTENSGILVESPDLTKTAASEIYVQEDDKLNVGGTTKIVTPTATAAGGPLLVDAKHIALKTTISNSNKEIKGPQQTQQQYKFNQRQQKAADNSVASAAADQQRLKQASSFWSLGSLNWYLSYSGRRNSYKQRQKSAYSTLQYQRKRSKTQWHKPLTNAIFSSHFKEASRNEEFHIEQLVAKGAFGVVFKVIDKKSLNNDDNEKLQQQQQHPKQQQHKPQQPSECSQVITAATTLNDHPSVYALKVLKKSKIISENSLQQIKDEVDIQKLCGHHPFIVKQFDLWQNRYNLHILSEYIPNGELFNTIRTFSLNLIRLYLAEIALALDFLHNAGIIYRDAKPENILLTSNYHLKVTDFGLSKWLKLGLTTRTMCGTFQYMAPEILRGEPYTHAVDWWSLGIIVCQMFVERSPDVRKFINLNLPQHLKTQDNNFGQHLADSTKLFPDAENFLPPEVEGLCHEAKDVLKRLLEFDAQQRLRSVRALQRIAMFRDFKIEAKNCLRIQPLDIIAADNIIIAGCPESRENSFKAAEAFQNF